MDVQLESSISACATFSTTSCKWPFCVSCSSQGNFVLWHMGGYILLSHTKFCLSHASTYDKYATALIFVNKHDNSKVVF